MVKLDLSNIDVHYRPTDDSDPFATDIYYLSGEDDDLSRTLITKDFSMLKYKAANRLN